MISKSTLALTCSTVVLAHLTASHLSVSR